MKTNCVICLMLLLFFPAGLFAAQGGFQGESSMTSGNAGGGFSAPGISVSSVSEILTMRDDAHVVMRGYILRHLGKDKYLFKDVTGTITVEIDHDKWSGMIVTQTDQVELYGEVDKDMFSTEVEVDNVVKINK